MRKKIIVTGGCGYIGSHTVIELIESGYDVLVFDNLSNSTEASLDRIKQITGTRPAFFQIDLSDAKEKSLRCENFFNRCVWTFVSPVFRRSYRRSKGFL